jgi:hypothetical protein
MIWPVKPERAPSPSKTNAMALGSAGERLVHSEHGALGAIVV